MPTPEEEEEDFQDFLRGKADILGGLKNEFSEMDTLIGNLQAATLIKDREVVAKQAELVLTKDQIAGCKRVVEDSIAAQEGLEKMMATMGEKARAFADRENSNRSEIVQVDSRREELIESLSVGADWRPDQIEAKANLEKESCLRADSTTSCTTGCLPAVSKPKAKEK